MRAFVCEMIGWRKAWYQDYAVVRARLLAALVSSTNFLRYATNLLRKFSKLSIGVTEKGA